MWKILVVDDVFPNRQLLIEVLSEVAACDPAMNGEEALDLFKKAKNSKPYDAVLMDIAMPKVDGLNALKSIRALEAAAGSKPTPVLIITAFKEPFVEAFNLGCDDYLIKPVDVNELMSLLKRKLGEKH
jgi:two-component system chemotaxis response regulator CheY